VRVIDFLLPRTDPGVLAQVIALVALGAALLWLARPNRELQWFIGGVVVLTAGFMALRTLH
jgi:hypothetical protein